MVAFSSEIIGFLLQPIVSTTGKLITNTLCQSFKLNNYFIIIIREVSEIRIGAGEIARYPNQMEFPTLAVDKLIMHPFYKKEDHTHDIALIRMSGSFTWNELVQPICLSDLHLLLDPKLDEESSHLPSGDFGLLDETDPSSFRFSDMTVINELVNSSLIEAHKPSVDEEKLTLSNIPMSILAALSRLLTGGDDKDETISRTRSTESRAIAPSSSKVISDSIPFHPRNISLSNHLNEVSDSSPLSGMMATIVGWGFTGEKERGGQRSEMLLKVDVPIVANDKCQTWFEEESIKENTKLVVINDARICAGFESGGKDSCLGDSGGPLIVKQKGKYMVIGVVSTGIGCGRPKLPGIYTRVSSYFDWITESLES